MRRSRFHRRLLGAAAVVALTAPSCGPGSEAPSAASASVTDSAGVPFVDNGGTSGLLGDSLDVREVLRIGSPDAAGPGQFFRILDVEVDAIGRILVANGQTSTVRVFTPEGTFLFEVGGRGEGPGEFGAPNLLIPVEDARFAVADLQSQSQLSIFAPDGTLESEWPLHRPDGDIWWLHGRGPGGWLGTLDRGAPPPEGWASLEWTERYELRSFELGSGETSGVLAVLPTRIWRRSSPEATVTRPMFSFYLSPSFGLGGSVVHGSVEGYRVYVRDPDGALVRVIGREVAQLPFPSDQMERYAARAAALIDTTTIWGDMPAEAREQQKTAFAGNLARQSQPTLPELRSPIASVLAGADGSVWVERGDVVPAEEYQLVDDWLRGYLVRRPPDYPSTWDVFDPRGLFLGTAVLPRRFDPLAADGLTVTGVQRDDLDVEYVVRLEVSGEGGG